jgi:acetyltransferase-like isoleucine patch superfamily enzyme
MSISNKAEVRLAEGGQLVIHPSAKIDDYVRIVVSATGRMVIGENSKIGKGSIINCGGTIEIGRSVAVYGYCYFQSSIWTNGPDGRIYNHGIISVGDNAIISPYCVIAHSAVVGAGEIVPPHRTLGNWFDLDFERTTHC